MSRSARTTRPVAFASAAFAWAILGPLPEAAAQPAFTTIMLSGDPVPGVSGSTFMRLADPRLSSSYHLAFWGDAGTTLAEDADDAIFIDRGTGPALLVREGSALPSPGVGGIAGVRLSPSGRAWFPGTITTLPNQAARLALFAEPAPGQPLQRPADEPLGGPFIAPLPTLDDAGTAVYLFNETFFSGCAPINVGDPAPLGTTTLPNGSTFRRLAPPVLASDGGVFVHAQASDVSTPAAWRQGLWRLDASCSLGAIVAEGDPAPGGPRTFTDLSREPMVDASGAVVFWAAAADAAQGERRHASTGLYRAEGGSIVRLIATGDTLPDGSIIGGVDHRAATAGGSGVLALVRLAAPALPGANSAIVSVRPGELPIVVLREGEPAPDGSGAAVGSLGPPSVNSVGGAAFIFSHAGTPQRRAVLAAAVRPGSTLWPLARVGDLFDIPGRGVSRTVRDLSFDHDAAAGAAQFVGRVVVFTLGFTDGSSGVFRAVLPAAAPVADITHDGVIDLADFFAFFEAYESASFPADLDENPGVDLADYFAFFQSFDTGT